ncbi:MAG: CarD family transcriptional regulator [Parvularculaceae bacterium]
MVKEKPAVPKKKLNVGQKPRSTRPDLPLKPSSLITPQRELESSTTVKATPASKEAKQNFKVNDHVVYPAHGVGRIVSIEKQHIAGITNELFVIDFEQEKMKLRVPTAKAMSVGMRGLADDGTVKKAIDTLKGRARIKRTMWSRRAQEYEAKINSGDIISVAEVVRDLYRATDQPEQSYSERQLFEAALDRLAREVAAVRKSDMAQALSELDASLQQKKAA